jgi:hypothetical protein
MMMRKLHSAKSSLACSKNFWGRPSPKKTMSGLTTLLQSSHVGTTSSSNIFALEKKLVKMKWLKYDFNPKLFGDYHQKVNLEESFSGKKYVFKCTILIGSIFSSRLSRPGGSK